MIQYEPISNLKQLGSDIQRIHCRTQGPKLKKKKKKVLKQNKKDNKANMINNMILDQLNEIRPSLIARKPKMRSPGLGSS